MITTKDVEHVALLARLELNDEEKKVYAKQLGAILDHVNMLAELDTDKVLPMTHILPLKNVFRSDVNQGKHMPVEEVLGNAPEKEGDFFKVPRIV